MLLSLLVLIPADIRHSNKRPSVFWKRVGTDDGLPLFLEPSASSKPKQDPQLPIGTLPPPTTSTLGTESLNGEPAHAAHSASELFQDGQSEDHGPPSPRKYSSSSTIARPIRRDQTPQDVQKRNCEPRKFHLTNATLSANSQHHISKAPSEKQRKSRKQQLAVFVEKTGKALKAQQAHKDGTGDRDAYAQTTVVEEQEGQRPQRPRKRPNATAAERKWRTDNWGRPVEPNRDVARKAKSAQSVNEPSDQWDYESPQLAGQLQQIALEEIQAQEKQSNNLNPPQLKTQPKPPKPRPSRSQQSVDNHSTDNVMIDAADIDEDSLYVFDTYVRSSAGQDGANDNVDLNIEALRGMSSGNFGIIVIDDDQEELWETYGQYQESDVEWNSEEEDENGSCNAPCSR